jgi:hypothetical protein
MAPGFTKLPEFPGALPFPWKPWTFRVLELRAVCSNVCVCVCVCALYSLGLKDLEYLKAS